MGCSTKPLVDSGIYKLQKPHGISSINCMIWVVPLPSGKWHMSRLSFTIKSPTPSKWAHIPIINGILGPCFLAGVKKQLGLYTSHKWSYNLHLLGPLLDGSILFRRLAHRPRLPFGVPVRDQQNGCGSSSVASRVGIRGFSCFGYFLGGALIFLFIFSQFGWLGQWPTFKLLGIT